MKSIFIRSILGIFLFTACLVPVFARADETPAQRAVGYLASMQNADGGLHEKDQSDSAALQTAWSIVGLAASGIDPATVKTGLLSVVDYETVQACNYIQSTDIERSVLALVAAGTDLDSLDCNYKNMLSGLVNNETGQIGESLISTVFGIFAFKAAALDVPEASSEYIVSQQKPNGGWDSGWGTESNITAQALNALAIVDFENSDEAILKAKNYLKSLQTDDGGIKYSGDPWISGADAFSDAYTLQAIYALGESPEDDFWAINGNSTLEHLMKFQKEDGSFYFSFDPWGDGTPVWTTAIVLPSISQKFYPVISETLESADEIDLPENLAPIPTPVTPVPPVEPQREPELPQSVVNVSEREQAALQPRYQAEAPPVIIAAQTAPQPELFADLPEASKNDDLKPAVLGEDNSRQNSVPFGYLAAGLAVGLLIVFVARKRGLISVIIFVLTLSYSTRVQAGQAGLLIRHSNSVQKQFCISSDIFPLKSEDLFRLAGIEHAYDRGFLISLDGEQALTAWDEQAKNNYWSHWIDAGGGLSYANFGAQVKLVKENSVDAWQIGSSEKLLTDVELDNICQKEVSVSVKTEPSVASPTPPPLEVAPQKEPVTQEVKQLAADTLPKSNDSKTVEAIQSPEVSVDIAKTAEPRVLGASDSSDKPLKIWFFLAGILPALLYLLAKRYIKLKNG